MPTPDPTSSRLITMNDVLHALALADDRGIRCVRAELPDGIESAMCDGQLYVDPRMELGLYGRRLVDGIGQVAEMGERRERPRLTVVSAVPEPHAPDGWPPRAAG